MFSGDCAKFPWGKGFMHCKVQTGIGKGKEVTVSLFHGIL